MRPARSTVPACASMGSWATTTPTKIMARIDQIERH